MAYYSAERRKNHCFYIPNHLTGDIGCLLLINCLKKMLKKKPTHRVSAEDSGGVIVVRVKVVLKAELRSSALIYTQVVCPAN